MQLSSRGDILNDQMFRSTSSADYISRAAKVVTLVDLAGHERYFKTTAYGLTGHLPDYACLIVSANNGALLPAFHSPLHACTRLQPDTFILMIATLLHPILLQDQVRFETVHSCTCHLKEVLSKSITSLSSFPQVGW